MLAMILSFIWIVLMRWIAWPMVWLTIILFILLFGFGKYVITIKMLTYTLNNIGSSPADLWRKSDEWLS